MMLVADLVWLGTRSYTADPCCGNICWDLDHHHHLDCDHHHYKLLWRQWFCLAKNERGWQVIGFLSKVWHHWWPDRWMVTLHTSQCADHTAQHHRATAHTNATLFTLLDYTLPSSLAMLCHNMCDTLWEQSDYNIIFNHCSPVHTGQWPHSTFPQMATLEHSSTQFWWPCFLPRFLSRNFQSESQTQSLILYSLQFVLHLQINHKKTETWFHLFICT